MTSKPEDYTLIGAASAPAFSRDGRTLFHLRGSSLPQIWALDLDSGLDRQLTDHDEKVAFLRRAPNDDRLIYGIDAGGDERQQLWLAEGHTVRPLTAEPQVIHDFGGWSPDGTHIAYAANDRAEADFDVLIRPLAGETGARLYQGQGLLNVAGWSPDGRQVAVVESRSFADQSLLLLEVIGGGHHEVRRDRPTRYEVVRWDRQGNGLLALTDADGRDFLALARIDPATDAVSFIYEAPGRDVEAWALSPDGGLLATIENDRGYAILRAGPVNGERPALDLPRGMVADLAFSADGGRLAFTVSTPAQPAGLWTWEAATGCIQPVWRADPYAEAGIAPESFRGFDLVEWESFDGRRVPGWLAFPKGQAPASGWPAVIWVHGGPASQARANFRPDMQMLLAQGFAVLMPNVRGSTGYGREWALSDERENRLHSVHDLAHGARWLAAHPAIDAARIAVMGQSYGGYMVNAAVTEYPELWKAAVNYYGIADFVTLLNATGPWRRSHRAHEYGFPETDGELFRRISPIHHVDRITAPMLLLHGRRDPRVPFGESEQIAEALRLRQKSVRFEEFDYAGHGFIRPDHRRRVYAAVADFLNLHLR